MQIKKNYLNFNALEILPSLLNKTKIQSIRKAWEDSFSKRQGITDRTILIDAKFKVGDIIDLIWKKDSKYNWFDRTTGEGVNIEYFSNADAFYKKLGTVEIIEVFQVEIDWPKKDISIIKVIRNNKKLTMGEVEDLAQRDGFTGEDNGSDLLNCLNKIYDLMGQCREFHTSRWRWL